VSSRSGETGCELRLSFTDRELRVDAITAGLADLRAKVSVEPLQRPFLHSFQHLLTAGGRVRRSVTQWPPAALQVTTFTPDYRYQ